MRIPSSWKKAQKPEKDAFSGVKMAFLGLKTRKCMLCDVMLLAHQRVHVLQVMATVARGYGCSTGFSSFFQLFELCKTDTDGGKSILHSSDREVKMGAMVRHNPFLVETSVRGETWWTASTTPDKTNGLNRKSLTGLDVVKLRGEGTPPWTRCVVQMGHGP